MTLIGMLAIGASLLYTEQTFAQLDPCIADSNGVCDNLDEPINPITPGNPGAAKWVGIWIDAFGNRSSVSASTFEACTALLQAVTANQIVTIGTCRRVS